MNSFKDLRKLTVDQLKKLLSERLSKSDGELTSRLAQAYYQQASPSDLAQVSLDDCYGALLCLWQFIQYRKPGQALIHIYNPEPEEHHWHSTHSIIEILVDDMPFLVASLLMELDRQEIQVHNLLHPVIKIQRDEQGKLVSLEKSKGHKPEALMRIEVDRQSDAVELEKVAAGLQSVIHDVKCAVEDWDKMEKHLNNAISWCSERPMPASDEELEETLAFLEWLRKDNFLFVGFRYYQLGQS